MSSYIISVKCANNKTNRSKFNNSVTEKILISPTQLVTECRLLGKQITQTCNKLVHPIVSAYIE